MPAPPCPTDNGRLGDGRPSPSALDKRSGSQRSRCSTANSSSPLNMGKHRSSPTPSLCSSSVSSQGTSSARSERQSQNSTKSPDWRVGRSPTLALDKRVGSQRSRRSTADSSSPLDLGKHRSSPMHMPSLGSSSSQGTSSARSHCQSKQSTKRPDWKDCNKPTLVDIRDEDEVCGEGATEVEVQAQATEVGALLTSEPLLVTKVPSFRENSKEFAKYVAALEATSMSGGEVTSILIEKKMDLASKGVEDKPVMSTAELKIAGKQENDDSIPGSPANETNIKNDELAADEIKEQTKAAANVGDTSCEGPKKSNKKSKFRLMISKASRKPKDEEVEQHVKEVTEQSDATDSAESKSDEEASSAKKKNVGLKISQSDPKLQADHPQYEETKPVTRRAKEQANVTVSEDEGPAEEGSKIQKKSKWLKMSKSVPKLQSDEPKDKESNPVEDQVGDQIKDKTNEEERTAEAESETEKQSNFGLKIPKLVPKPQADKPEDQNANPANDQAKQETKDINNEEESSATEESKTNKPKFGLKMSKPVANLPMTGQKQVKEQPKSAAKEEERLDEQENKKKKKKKFVLHMSKPPLPKKPFSKASSKTGLLPKKPSGSGKLGAKLDREGAEAVGNKGKDEGEKSVTTSRSVKTESATVASCKSKKHPKISTDETTVEVDNMKVQPDLNMVRSHSYLSIMTNDSAYTEYVPGASASADVNDERNGGNENEASPDKVESAEEVERKEVNELGMGTQRNATLRQSEERNEEGVEKTLDEVEIELREYGEEIRAKDPELQSSYCDLMSCFVTCAGGTTSPNDVMSIESHEEHFILNHVPDDDHVPDEDVQPSFLWTDSLLNEVKDVEKSLSLLDAKQLANSKNMTNIKQNLADHQYIPLSAPEEVRQGYYRALSRAAVLNARMESCRAELELRRIDLESMRVEKEIDGMNAIKADDSFVTMEYDSDDKSFFGAFVDFVDFWFQEKKHRPESSTVASSKASMDSESINMK